MKYKDEVLADTPVAYWRCNDASGDLTDETGNGNTAVVQGSIDQYQIGALIENDIEANAIQISYAEADIDSVTASLGGNSITIEAILILNSGNDLQYLTDSSIRTITAPSADTAGEIGMFDGNAWHEPGTFPNDGEPHHCVWQFDGSTGRIFLDGTQVGSDFSINARDFTTQSTFRLFKRHDDNRSHLEADIAEIAIYASALTSTRIATHNDARFFSGVLSGSVEGETTGSTIEATIRAYLKATNELIGEKILDGTETSYSITTTFNEPHTIVAIPPNGSGLPSKILHDVTPVEQ